MNNDAVTIASHVHTIIFENDRVRVLDVTMKPDDIAQMHTHPENMVYVTTGGLLRFTNDHGESKDVQLAVGQVTYNKAGSHIVENIGETELKAVQVEFK